MRVAGDWLARPATQAVMAMLAAGGHRALAVGGCVRDALLGGRVSDVDIATDALPERVLELAAAARLKAVPTGIGHGTVTVVCDGIGFEVTTFRRDVETFGRHATVVFSTRIEEDAARRDFTMNALYAEADGTVIDPLGGLPDLLARRVRFVGRPADRIREDYLRILRFFRFHACHGDPAGGLDAEGLAACAALGAGVDTLSRERVGAEMRKLLAAPDPAPAVAAMAAAGILARVLPGAEARLLPVMVHLESGLAPRWLRRLATLGGEDADERLRLSRAESRALSQIAAGAADMLGPAALACELGADAGTDALLLRAARLGEALPDGWQDEIVRGSTAHFPIAAHDLMPALTGAALGARLAALRRRWLESGLRLEREELLG